MPRERIVQRDGRDCLSWRSAKVLLANNKLLEEQRLFQRTQLTRNDERAGLLLGH